MLRLTTVGVQRPRNLQREGALDSHKRPMLTLDNVTGEFVIGNFSSKSFAGGPRSCDQLGAQMVSDIGGPDGMLSTVADTELISVNRICAQNGSILLSCRNGNVTVSPRRARPDDGCSR